MSTSVKMLDTYLLGSGGTVAQRRKRLLDVERILGAALALIDERGRLTMADLAARLGTSASSVYHHVSGRAEIVELLREWVLSGAVVAPRLDGGDWVTRLAEWLRSYRAALAIHPNLIPLLVEHTMTARSALRDYDRVAVILREAGVPLDETMLWITVLDCYIVGAAFDLAAPQDVWRIEAGELPSLDAALRVAPRGRRRADAAFELGLDALLDGLRRRVELSRAGRP